MEQTNIREIVEANYGKLIKKALSLPDDTHVEVSYRNGRISFSGVLYGNNWTTNTKTIGNLKSMSYDDVSGFHLRQDGRVEIDGGDEEGEYYDDCEIVSRKEALERLFQVAQDEEWEMI